MRASRAWPARSATRPPAPLPSAAYGHGFAISAVGAKDDCTRMAAGRFIAWATSRRSRRGCATACSATTTGRARSRPYFKHVAPQIQAGLNDTNPVTQVTIWRTPQWPDIGDNLGIALEQVFTGTQTDVRGTLDDADQYAKDALEHGARK